MEEQGASDNERLLSAAKTDNEELLLDIFKQPTRFNINFQDGLGNTPLHYAVLNGSVTVIEHILSHEDCDVDPQNRMTKSTPLHLAVLLKGDDEVREYMVQSLLDAGADNKIKDKSGSRPSDLVSASDRILSIFRKAEAEASISKDDIASDDDDDDPGSDAASDD